MRIPYLLSISLGFGLLAQYHLGIVYYFTYVTENHGENTQVLAEHHARYQGLVLLGSASLLFPLVEYVFCYKTIRRIDQTYVAKNANWLVYAPAVLYLAPTMVTGLKWMAIVWFDMATIIPTEYFKTLALRDTWFYASRDILLMYLISGTGLLMHMVFFAIAVPRLDDENEDTGFYGVHDAWLKSKRVKVMF